ncbi:MAG: hypothetical protein Ct9H300mP11_27230 [Chloroflexota bacterium]|nr:MAG: hypothetical protein Ct9H300mP11_27230 [Chloroflexota bacterium]
MPQLWGSSKFRQKDIAAAASIALPPLGDYAETGSSFEVMSGGNHSVSTIITGRVVNGDILGLS